jgi:Domain of unknown function (DUF4386)
MKATGRKSIDSTRRASLATGVFFIITFIASIPALFFYSKVLHNPNFILGAGGDTRVAWGAFLEVITLVAGIGSAVAIFPIVKRQNESVALGYVTARVIESMIIMAGILSLMAIVTLRQDLAGAASTDAGTLIIAGRSLVAVHKWSFLMGPGLLGAGVGNGLLLGYLMYKSGLVPRPMAVVGLIGGTLIVASGIAVLFGVIDAGSKAQAVMTAPEFVWEAFLGIYLTFWGFKSCPIIADSPRVVELGEASAVPAAART